MPIPASPQEPGVERPNSSTYREVCESYTCGGKETVISPQTVRRNSWGKAGYYIYPVVKAKHMLGSGRFRLWPSFARWPGQQ